MTDPHRLKRFDRVNRDKSTPLMTPRYVMLAICECGAAIGPAGSDSRKVATILARELHSKHAASVSADV